MQCLHNVMRQFESISDSQIPAAKQVVGSSGQTAEVTELLEAETSSYLANLAMTEVPDSLPLSTSTTLSMDAFRDNLAVSVSTRCPVVQMLGCSGCKGILRAVFCENCGAQRRPRCFTTCASCFRHMSFFSLSLAYLLEPPIANMLLPACRPRAFSPLVAQSIMAPSLLLFQVIPPTFKAVIYSNMGIRVHAW